MRWHRTVRGRYFIFDMVKEIEIGNACRLSRLETIHQFLDWLMLPLAKALLARLETGQFPETSIDLVINWQQPTQQLLLLLAQAHQTCFGVLCQVGAHIGQLRRHFGRFCLCQRFQLLHRTCWLWRFDQFRQWWCWCYWLLDKRNRAIELVPLSLCRLLLLGLWQSGTLAFVGLSKLVFFARHLSLESGPIRSLFHPLELGIIAKQSHQRVRVLLDCLVLVARLELLHLGQD